MGKVTGGLLSLRARGSVADTLTFATWKGRPYVRQKVIPANPNTVAQQTTRTLFRVASGLWKNMGPLWQGPWDSAAQGQVKTGRNIFIAEFVRRLRGDANLDDLLFSPGSKGGPAPASVTAVAGVGQVTITVVPPSLPTGWTVTACQAALLGDSDPLLITNFASGEGEDLAAPYDIVIGSAAGVLAQCGGWVKYAKPDGSVAYSPSLNDTATPT